LTAPRAWSQVVVFTGGKAEGQVARKLGKDGEGRRRRLD
jgi:hypothetical protein